MPIIRTACYCKRLAKIGHMGTDLDYIGLCIKISNYALEQCSKNLYNMLVVVPLGHITILEYSIRVFIMLVNVRLIM